MFEEREILSPWGGRTGCYAWWYRGSFLCDHEHDHDEPICEDARIAMATIRARAARTMESQLGS